VTALLGDTHSPVAPAFVSRIAALELDHPSEAGAQALLRDWDHRMDAGSSAAAVYGAVRGELVRIVSHDLGLIDDRLQGVAGPSLHQTLRFVNARLAFWIEDDTLVPDDAVRAALRFAVRSLELTQGSDPTRWRWGAAHTALFVHPLATWRADLADQLAMPPAVELGGDNECVWATSTAPPSTAACNGPVARYVFDLADWDRSVWIVPHGVSGDPRSPHHLDQLERWARIEMLPMRFSRPAVDDATASTTTFSTNEASVADG
jgi:penicillin amidase